VKAKKGQENISVVSITPLVEFESLQQESTGRF